ncbi:MAG: prepilin-type N-terminal cleavage/methylation domain-containing protein [Dissulfurispiraceae bacterium]
MRDKGSGINSLCIGASQRGFTLIEILISTGILLIAVAGFLAWAANVVNQRAGLSKRNFAYNIAVDVSDRLAKLSGTNVFLLPNSSGTIKYLGLDSNGNLLTCLAGVLTSNGLTFDATGMTQYTNPWNGTMNNLFLYHDSLGTFSASAPLTTTANAFIDHPNSSDVANLGLPDDINSLINPIRRSANGVTYYVAWSVAYMPCATAPTNLVKIFITVYWIDPEPSFSSTITQVNNYIQSHPLSVKNVSITLDKSLTATQ